MNSILSYGVNDDEDFANEGSGNSNIQDYDSFYGSNNNININPYNPVNSNQRYDSDGWIYGDPGDDYYTNNLNGNQFYPSSNQDLNSLGGSGDGPGSSSTFYDDTSYGSNVVGLPPRNRNKNNNNKNNIESNVEKKMEQDLMDHNNRDRQKKPTKTGDIRQIEIQEVVDYGDYALEKEFQEYTSSVDSNSKNNQIPIGKEENFYNSLDDNEDPDSIQTINMMNDNSINTNSNNNANENNTSFFNSLITFDIDKILGGENSLWFLMGFTILSINILLVLLYVCWKRVNGYRRTKTEDEEDYY